MGFRTWHKLLTSQEHYSSRREASSAQEAAAVVEATAGDGAALSLALPQAPHRLRYARIESSVIQR